MAHGIHHALALFDEAHIEVGVHDTLARGERAADDHAFGRDDGRVATAAQPFLQGRVGGDAGNLLLVEPAAGVYHEAAGFQGVVADGDFHLVSENLSYHRARKLGTVDFLVLGHEGVTGQRVVVLPAGQGPHAAHGGGHGAQAAAVALAPNHALVVGGRDFTAVQYQFAGGVEHQLGVVKRTVVALVHAQHHHHAALAGGGGHQLGERPRHHHGLVVEGQVVFSGQHGRPHEGKVRVIRHHRFGKNDDFRPLPAGCADGVAHLFGGGPAVVQHRLKLGGGGFDDAGRGHWLRGG